jgi:hypothetical protein
VQVSGYPRGFRVSRSAGQCRVRTKQRSPIGARCSQLVTGVDHLDSAIDLRVAATTPSPGSGAVPLRTRETSDGGWMALGVTSDQSGSSSPRAARLQVVGARRDFRGGVGARFVGRGWTVSWCLAELG